MWLITSLQHFISTFLHIWLVEPCLRLYSHEFLSLPRYPPYLPAYLLFIQFFIKPIRKCLRKVRNSRDRSSHFVQNEYPNINYYFRMFLQSSFCNKMYMFIIWEGRQWGECFLNVSWYMLSSQHWRKRYIFTATICSNGLFYFSLDIFSFLKAVFTY